MIKAIIFGPGFESCSAAAERRMTALKAHIAKRGYNFVGYVCRPNMVVNALQDGDAQVVLFADPDPEMPLPESILEPTYETARLLPRGDDGGFAESFLEARHTVDT